MKRIILFITILSLLILTGFYLLFNNKRTQLPTSDNLKNVSDKQISLSEVSLHINKEDCWIVIEDNVYDISKFISKHPGGDIISTVCGTDATDKFNNRPGSGTSHSNLARKMLKDLRLGSLLH